jgi:hypothetical protein
MLETMFTLERSAEQGVEPVSCAPRDVGALGETPASDAISEIAPCDRADRTLFFAQTGKMPRVFAGTARARRSFMLNTDTLLRFAAVVIVPLVSACGAADAGDPTGSTDEALSRHMVDAIATISYAPNSYVIGNAYPGWHDDVQGEPQFASGPGNPNGAYYRWGYLYGESFDHCAWIDNSRTDNAGPVEPGAKCGPSQQFDTPYFVATFTNGLLNPSFGDGPPTHMNFAGPGCSDKNGYGNVDPWKVPATPDNSFGPVRDGSQLLWRYVSKDGNWVMVLDPSHDGVSLPNWYFVHRGCVSLDSSGS